MTSVNIVGQGIHITVSLVAPTPLLLHYASILSTGAWRILETSSIYGEQKGYICGRSAQRIPRSYACPVYLDLPHYTWASLH